MGPYGTIRCQARPTYATPLKLETGDGGGGGWLGGGTANAADPRVHSVFKVPGMHLLPELLLSRTGLKPIYDARDE